MKITDILIFFSVSHGDVGQNTADTNIFGILRMIVQC